MNQQERNRARELYAIFEMLRDSDEFIHSGTSKILKEHSRNYFLKRAGEEWKELTDEEHRHSDNFEADFLLESSQVFYWLALTAVVERKSFEEFEKEFASDLMRLKKLHEKNNIPIVKIFEKDLDECRKKGYCAIKNCTCR